MITYLFMLTGCFGDDGYKENGVYYDKYGFSNYAISIVSDYNADGTFIYAKDRIKGKTVTVIGVYPMIGKAWFGEYTGEKAVRIYFPWSIEETFLWEWESTEEDVTEYVITASTKKLVSITPLKNNKGGGKYVVSNYVFNEIEKGVFNRIHNVSNIEIENFIPANIVYFFNYEDEPNKGYFFIDIQEETGKLIKPPYDPQRKWYKFDGWYTEPECINKWDFDNDEVTISYDESGNRIYEEIKLYAKWKRSLFGI